MPKPRTAAQLASRERGQKRLNQKHLARKMWAGVRVASRLLAWLIRARARHPGCSADDGEGRSLALDGFVERSASLGLRAALSVPPSPYPGCRRMPVPLCCRPILIGRLLVQQWPATRDDAGIARLAEARRQRPSRRTLQRTLPAPPTSSAAAALGWQPPLALTLAAPPPPALALAPPPPPSQQQPSALAAAARAALDTCELQDDRGSKRDALARTPPPAAARRPHAPPAR